MDNGDGDDYRDEEEDQPFDDNNENQAAEEEEEDDDFPEYANEHNKRLNQIVNAKNA